MTTYACPLHPEIESHRQVTCSRCGLKLEPREEERATTGRKPKEVPVRER
jgi:hypothetical protein